MNIKSLKATRAGRVMVRFLGEEKGAVLMEYVVLGVLLVAAVVAAVIVFGNRTRDSFGVMTRAEEGDTPGAAAAEAAAQARSTAGTAAAEANGQAINKGNY